MNNSTASAEIQDEIKLTGKQLWFVEAYVGEAAFNATEAARIAGYSGNDLTLRVVACENPTKPNVRRAIDARLRSAHVSSEEVLAEYPKLLAGLLTAPLMSGTSYERLSWSADITDSLLTE